MRCELCPRECGIDRSVKRGFCGCGENAVIARAALHYWEEPCISGKEGSGTVFFCGCTLRCAFCQNSSISRSEENGTKVSPKELSEIMRRLEGEGANNINLVTPTQYVGAVIRALDIYRPNIPIVYNTGGYEKIETLKMLEGKVDIYLPDYKYADKKLAKELSGAEDYPETAFEAIKEMIRQTGDAKYDERGIMQKGTIVRHLILPGHVMNTLSALKKLAELPKVPVSVMAQFTPVCEVQGHPELSRRLTEGEISRAASFVERHGIEGYIQSLESADEGFIPAFDGTGVKNCL